MPKTFLDSQGLGTYDQNIKDYIDNIVETDIAPAIDAKVSPSDLADVATSGDYDDLDNKPFASVGDGLVIKDNILGLDAFRTQVTISISEWSNYSCTRYIFEVTSDATIIVSPDIASYSECVSKAVICSGQGQGSLTFSCDTVPTTAITMNILILKSKDIEKIPLSMSVSGSWSNLQFAGLAPDPTGLVFTVAFSDGDILSVTPTSISPSEWDEETIGNQTATFSFTSGGSTVTCTKVADVMSPSAISDVLNENSWGMIHTVAASGHAADYWSVGDWKNVTVSAGTVGNLSIPAGTYRATIIGINHNPTKENPYSIDFAIGQTSGGIDVAFRGNSSGGTEGVGMTNTAGTSGGWVGSQMYTSTLPAFYNLLAGNSGLYEAMIAPKKYSHNTIGGSANDDEENVTLTEDSNYKLFLMSEYEIQGAVTHANPYEANYQAQYDYFKSTGLNKSKIRYKHLNTSTATDYWTRSPRCSSLLTTYYCMTSTNGSAGWDTSSDAHGIVPCFRV